VRLSYQSALNLSLPALAEIHSTAFGGGWRSDPDKLADIFRVQNVDLRLSLVAYDGRRSVGIALLGRRRAHGWLYDFAIAPAYRGQGVGTRLLTTLTREAIKAGVRDIELDVWEKRDDAIRLYERAGFQYHRSYLNFEATGAQLGLVEYELPAWWQLRTCAVEEVVSWYAAASEREPQPCWDRRLPSLLTIGDAQACMIADEHGQAACLHYAARAASGNDPDRIRPMFVGLRADATPAHLRGLLASAAGSAFSDLSTTVFRVALEPDQSTLSRLLSAAGMRTVGRALDMRLSLRQENA
jgi:ribosomal protein S18 acetylase RimI-like enzyme